MSAASDLLSHYQHVIDELTLITGSKGVYDVSVNGALLYSKDETGRHANEGEVLALFRDLAGDDVKVYGT